MTAGRWRHRPRLAGLALAGALACLPLAPGPLLAQRYMEPLPPRAGVRVDASTLADRTAAERLGIAVVGDAIGADRGERQVTGARAVLVVLGRFSDTPPSAVSPEQVREQMFTGTPTSRTLADFYEEQSDGRFTVTGDVTDWLQTDVTLLEGAGSRNGHGWAGDELGAHVASLLTQLDPELDFGQFDNDGPDGVPNSGDDDGRVDLLSIKFAEVAGYCGGPGPWPHFGAVSVDGAPFESDDSTPGGQAITAPIYIIDSVVECDGVTPQSMAVTAHELGHAVGLPDYYVWSQGPEAEYRHWTVGCFDLMAAGGWGCGDGPLPRSGFGPTGFSVYSRWSLGWAELQEVSVAQDETFVLEPLARSARGIRVRLAPESPESWIFEYRTRDGFDAPLPADGVLVYHLDTFQGARPWDPELPPPYAFHLVEADGDNALRRIAAEGGNRGVATDVFAREGPSGPYGSGTTPSTRDHLGGESTLRIHEIARTDASATLRLTVGSGFHVAARQLPSQVLVFQPVTGVIELSDGQAPYVVARQLGGLPDGVTLELDGSALSLEGTPRAAGTFGLDVWIEDQAGSTVAEAVSLQVGDDPSLDPAALLRVLVGDQTLSSDQADYLDRSGNRDGSFDLGDLRAFVVRQPIG